MRPIEYDNRFFSLEHVPKPSASTWRVPDRPTVKRSRRPRRKHGRLCSSRSGFQDIDHLATVAVVVVVVVVVVVEGKEEATTTTTTTTVRVPAEPSSRKSII